MPLVCIVLVVFSLSRCCICAMHRASLCRLLFFAMTFISLLVAFLALFVFFFQAEDGIRDTSVTGVQTCAFRSAKARSNLLAWTSHFGFEKAS